jgi:hypothetical protein
LLAQLRQQIVRRQRPTRWSSILKTAKVLGAEISPSEAAFQPNRVENVAIEAGG